jgi:phosphoribosylglycinamide formyltransferase-1
LRVVVLASGEGTLLQSMIDDLGEGVDIVAVGADRPCRALERAEEVGFPSFLVDYNPDRVADYDRDGWNGRLADEIAAFSPDVIVSAGFMRIIGPAVTARFAGRIINTHPALLPSFAGAHAVEDALEYGVSTHWIDRPHRRRRGGHRPDTRATGRACSARRFAGDAP